MTDESARAPTTLGQRVVAIRRQRTENLVSLAAAFSPLAGLVLGAASVSLTSPDDPNLFLFFFGGSSLGAILLALFSVALSKWGPQRAMVTVTEQQLVLGLLESTRSIARDGVVSGTFMPAEQRLELTLRNGDVLELEAHSEQEADALAALLGVGPEQRHALFEQQRPAARTAMGCVGALTLLPWLAATAVVADTPIGALGLAFIVVSTALTILAFRWAVNRPSIRVGVDGVSIRRRGKERRWPVPAIARVDAADDALVITDKSGTDERIRVGPSAARAARDRIRGLVASASSLAPERAGLLDELLSARDGRRERLSKLLSSAGEYRAAAWSADDLVALVADPRVSRRKRVGAAWALGLGGGDADKHRARVASARIGQPELRVAVERALDDRLAEREIEELAAEEEADVELPPARRHHPRD